MINILYSHLKKKLGLVEAEDEIRDVSITKVNNADENKMAEENESQTIEVKSDEKVEFNGRIKTAEKVNDDGDTNDFFTIIINDEEHYASVKNLPCNLYEGDRVAVIIEKNDQDIQAILDIKPKMKKEFGRVTTISFEQGYAIFENKTLLMFSHMKNMRFQLKMHEEFMYEVIESDQKYDAKMFDYRVVNLLEKVNSIVSGHGISIKSEPFKIYLNSDKENRDHTISKYILVRNRSDKSVNILTVKTIPDEDDLLKLDMAGKEINFNLSARNGTFKIFFRVKPSKPGCFKYKLIAQFNGFEETHDFSVEVTQSYVISGPKMRVVRFVDVKIGEYPVPCELREVDYSKRHLALEELTNLHPVLAENINANNYVEKMQLGIYLEEIAMEQAFAGYRIEEATFVTKGEFLRLTVKDVAEKRPSIIVGDKVIATDPFRTAIFEGCIHKVENESILCKFHTDFHESHRDKTFTVDFNFSRTTYRRQHFALEQVTSSGLGFDFLFPSKIESKRPQVDAMLDAKGNLQVNAYARKWFNNLLNKHQKDAVVAVLRGENRPLPYIFFGCPGSGKTQTVIEAILQIHTLIKSSRIIIATPSNSAANLVTQQLINSNVFDPTNPKFLRLVSNNQVEKELIPESLIKYCATISIAAEDNQNRTFERNDQGVLKNVTKNKILEYRIIIATLNCCGSLLQMKFHSKFSHIFIDESGQSVEPETLIPLTLLDKNDGQCVLAGDPKQLGPILTSRYGKIFNYNYSFMERLLFDNLFYEKVFGTELNEYDPKFVTKLIINYRALPSLLKVYNDLFYNGELESKVDEKNSIEASLMSNADAFLWKNTNKKCSVFFVNVNNGRNRKIQESCSWYNEEEVRAVMSFLHKCSSSQVEFKEIGIVTPYSLQVKKLKHQIAVGTSETDLKIGTVEEFQGQERLIIIVSTVRTEQNVHSDQKFGLGFLQCPKRMNVAISRGRALLVVFGKESILSKDENWNHLIKYAKDNRTYVSENF